MSFSFCTAFAGNRLLASGTLIEAARAAKAFHDRKEDASVLLFDDETGRPVDIDFRGSPAEVEARLAPEVMPKRGPGRPKLGVVAREVTLLPRHWEWLQEQPGGASIALRRLVEEAKRGNQDKNEARRRGEAFHSFATAMAGDFPGFEEALRAFYARDGKRFAALTEPWPRDVRDHARKLAARALENGAEAEAS